MPTLRSLTHLQTATSQRNDQSLHKSVPAQQCKKKIKKSPSLLKFLKTQSYNPTQNIRTVSCKTQY
jgi:hypothetical protein